MTVFKNNLQKCNGVKKNLNESVEIWTHLGTDRNNDNFTRQDTL